MPRSAFLTYTSGTGTPTSGRRRPRMEQIEQIELTNRSLDQRSFEGHVGGPWRGVGDNRGD